VLNTGDFVEIGVEPGDTQFLIAAYDPLGKKIRAVKLAAESHQKFRFIATLR
jgi:hypothetical protein